MPLVSKTFADIITFTRASTSTYFNSAGVLTSSAIDTPRLDYNPATLDAQGLLIEEQRVNLLTYSSEFDNAAWVKTGTVSVAANTVTSITGNVDADTLTTISGGANRVSQATTVAVSTSYAFSLFVKSGDINGITFRLFFSGGTSIDTYADFIFSSATFTNVIGAGAFTQQSIGNGWYRITCVLASGNNTAVDLRVGGLITTVQTGSTAYLYGAQFEAGAFATSYIPTSTVALTRAADVASVNTLSPWYNASEGTLYVEASNAQGAAPSLFSIDDGTTTNRIITFANLSSNPSFRVVSGGVEQANFSAGSISLGAAFKLAGAYKVNDFAASLNGAAVVTDTSGSVPTGQTTARLGLNVASAAHINGYLRRITYYPRRLSDAELQSITT